MRSTQRAHSALVIALVYLFDELIYVINKVALSWWEAHKEID